MITNPKAKQKKGGGAGQTISLNLEHMFWKSICTWRAERPLQRGAGAEDLLVNRRPLPWRPS